MLARPRIATTCPPGHPAVYALRPPCGHLEPIDLHEGRELADQVVVFPDDQSATAGLVGEYAALLADPRHVRTVTLSQVLDSYRPAASSDDGAWLRRFHTRYVDLDLSSALFDAWITTSPPFQ